MTETKNKTGKRVVLNGITKRFGDFVAVSDINVDVEAGEFCTLLGPSGSGKTTILKMIAGFETPTRGTITIDNRDVSNVSVSKREIGMVFQNYALFPHMTVESNISFPLEMRRLSKNHIRRQVQEVLGLVDLVGFGDRYPRQLSGGQQQRVALARALVFNPDILLMDEPLGALDKNLRQNLQVELKKLHRRLGVTIIYVTHDQEEAMHLSDKVVVTNAGRVEQIGSSDDLYNKPNNVFVASFLGECNLMPGTVKNTVQQASTVTLANGNMVTVLQNADRFSIGQSVMVGVRPENLRIGPGAGQCVNCFDVLVDEVIFSGENYKHYLQDKLQTLIATMPNRKGIRPCKPGDSILLGFTPEDAFLLAPNFDS
jgi:spermidine/putrescine ABC transporter ATP-binding subunit